MSNNKPKQKAKLWQYPWGYRESFLIAFFILLTGFLVELISGGGIRMPAWPVNIAIIVIFIIYFFLVHSLIKHPIVKWLSSPKAAIASISAFTLMVLLLGFISQGGNMEDPRLIDSLGLTHVISSWPYLMSALYLLVVLGFTIVRRARTFSIKNIAFLLNHTGLWIVVVAASLGSADMWRLSMQLEMKHPVTTAYDSHGQAYNMSFGMQLLDFTIEEYEPQVGLMRNADFMLQMEKGGKLATVKEGTTAELENYSLSFEKYIDKARKYDDIYDTTSVPGGSHAVYIVATDEQSGQTVEGWVSDGSFNVPASYLTLNNELSVAMTQVRPKEYSSDIRIYHTLDEYEDFYIEVNKPLSIDGWKVYQVGYDELLGRWSERSVIELVRDPWLPVVYVGIFMILFGTLYLLWMGKGRIKTKKA
ncbi:MAG: hypothetical protein DRI97_06775 [Bacteroidetes bacterium]|nr:MAG: hypothetical protein DRI97_06775 [Bacteroidota bacterium]